MDSTGLDILFKLVRLGQRKQVRLQWNPSHVGVPGNEADDELATNRTEIPTYGFDVIMINVGLRREFLFPFMIAKKQGTQQLETEPGFEQTQEESIRTGPESVVANRVALARERKTKLTHPGGDNCDVNGHVHPNDTQVRSNSQVAQLIVPNDPRYARLEKNLEIGQAKEG
ncbi:hypothetical protein TNCV_1907911 [Trichonephila clavipes]|nr:hypothetical protein TNCV_1907911 [Trichonephila clavipes]